MLGSISIISIAVLGYIQAPLWILVPFAIANAFIGLHFPKEKANMLRSRGQYWPAFFASLPLQAVIAAAVYGIGYGAHILIGWN